MEPPIGGLRTIEVACLVAAAADLGMGQPSGSSLRTALLSLGFSRRLGWDAEAQSEVLYLSLLHWAGCSSHGHEFAVLFDDEIEVHRRAITMDFASWEPLAYIARHAGAGRGATGRARTLTRAVALGPAFTRQVFAASCEVAEQIALGLALPSRVSTGLRTVFERWDGRGFPGVRSAESIPAAVRLVQVVHDWSVFERMAGTVGAARATAARAGRGLDPTLAHAWLAEADAVNADSVRLTGGRRAFEVLVAEEPGAPSEHRGDMLDAALGAVADFADIKTPFTLGQSADVHRLVAAAGSFPGAPLACQAAWVSSLGRVGVPIGVWERAGALSGDDWDLVRLYPAHGERLLAAAPTLRVLADVAGMVQERSDGSGYYRQAGAAGMPAGASLLQAASVAVALRRSRPHRPAYPESAVTSILGSEVAAGRLDRRAVDAVLGSSPPPAPSPWPAGLTDREVDVLRLALTGLTKRQIAGRLFLSPHTVDTHLRHVYGKLGVSTRAAAAVSAIRLGIPLADRANA